MKKLNITLFLVLLIGIVLNAQTSGKLSVTFTTSQVGGNYAPKNVVAIWIEDDGGNFVKTLLAYAGERKTHLNTWQAATNAAGSEYNTVDAITGATRTSHNTRNCTWDGTDYNGVNVPNGNYKIWMELTDKNSTGNFSSIQFVKGENPFTHTPSDEPSFSSIELKWSLLDIEFAEGTSTTYLSGQEVTFDIDVINEGAGIGKVEFFIDDELVYTDETLPYSFSYTFGDGQFLIKAIASSSDELTEDTDLLVINVGTFTKTDYIPVLNSSDDAEEGSNNGAMALESSDLELGEYDTWTQDGIEQGLQTIGVRFPAIEVPANSTIVSANILFTCDKAGDGPAEMTIYGEDAGDPLTFSNNFYDITSRAKTTQSVVWPIPEWIAAGDAGEAQTTTDIASVVQALVYREDWVSGNSMAFIFEHSGVSIGVTDPDAGREAETFDGSSSDAPTLVCTYTFDASLILDIEEQLELRDTYIYPNPITNTLSFNIKNTCHKVLVEIADISGKIVYSQTKLVSNGNININPGITQKGVYIINVYSPEKLMLLSQKFIQE